jgi:3-oxoacyl-[acyl-carrier-protein] synthase-3
MAGIIDFDIAYPASRLSVEHLHELSGIPVDEILDITVCESFPVLGEGEPAWELAMRSALRVLERTAVPRQRITHVIYAGSGLWDTPFWSPAAKVAHSTGIEQAHCYEVTNFCNATMTAIRVAAGQLRPGDFALVLSGEGLSRLLDHTDSDSRYLFNFGDAGAAVLIGTEDYAFDILHTAMRTDPSWCDYYSGVHRGQRVAIRRQDHRPGLGAAYLDNFTSLVRDTLDTLGRGIDDIAYFLVNHGDLLMHERVLEELEIPPQRSVFNYDRLGHMGGVDTLIALGDLAHQQRLRKGDLVLLATSAMGFSWGITALESR